MQTIHQSVSVSYNRPVDEAIAEQEKYEKQGYVVTSTYGNDYDCGNILEYAYGENREDVMKRHREHMEICNQQRKRLIKWGIIQEDPEL